VANTITNVLPKMLAQGVLALRQNAVTPRLVNRDYESVAAQKGNVINVPIPSAIAARAVTPSVVMNSNVASSPTVALITLDHWYEAPFEVSDNDVISMSDTFFPMQASEAVKALANDADQYLLGKHTGFYGAAGTVGTTPFNGSLTVGGTARKLLNKQLAPMDQRFGIIDPDAENNFLLNANILQADQRGDQGGIIAGSIGTKLGIAWYMNQNVSSYTPGTAWVTGHSIVTAGVAAGAFTLTAVNATASGTVLVGDIFTIGGGTQQYVITANVTVTSSSGAGTHNTYTFYPAAATAAVSGAALTVIGTAYVVNLVANKYAMAWASRPLKQSLVDAHVFQSPTDPVSGIALRLEISRQYKLETLSYDYLAGAGVVRRELGVKILG
jgi:hypothetical protein